MQQGCEPLMASGPSDVFFVMLALSYAEGVVMLALAYAEGVVQPRRVF